MARGNIAKENLINKIISLLKDEYIGCFDKKYYFNSEENGEKVQISIALTCPKTPVGDIPEVKENFDWSQTNSNTTASSYQPAQITEDEKKAVADLMARLGL